MKKVLLGAIMAFLSVTAYAQKIIPSNYLGIKAGANYANVWSNGETTSAFYGGNAGLALNYQYTKRQGAIIELVYSQKGFIQPARNIKNSLTYLELPVLYKRTFFCPKKGGNVVERKRSGNFYAFGGPQLSILLSSKAKTHDSQLLPEGRSASNIDLYAHTRPFDISAVAGVGYALKNGLSIDARYALGFRSINGVNNSLIPRDANNSTLQLNLTYYLPLYL